MQIIQSEFSPKNKFNSRDCKGKRSKKRKIAEDPLPENKSLGKVTSLESMDLDQNLMFSRNRSYEPDSKTGIRSPKINLPRIDDSKENHNTHLFFKKGIDGKLCAYDANTGCKIPKFFKFDRHQMKRIQTRSTQMAITANEEAFKTINVWVTDSAENYMLNNEPSDAYNFGRGMNRGLEMIWKNVEIGDLYSATIFCHFHSMMSFGSFKVSTYFNGEFLYNKHKGALVHEFEPENCFKIINTWLTGDFEYLKARLEDDL